MLTVLSKPMPLKFLNRPMTHQAVARKVMVFELPYVLDASVGIREPGKLFGLGDMNIMEALRHAIAACDAAPAGALDVIIGTYPQHAKMTSSEPVIDTTCPSSDSLFTIKLGSLVTSFSHFEEEFQRVVINEALVKYLLCAAEMHPQAGGVAFHIAKTVGVHDTEWT